MKKIIPILFTILTTASARAQMIDNRVFSVLNEPYQELSSPEMITNSSTNWNSIKKTLPLGFNFTLFGQTTDSVVLEHILFRNYISLNLQPTSQALFFDAQYADRGNSSISYQANTANSGKVLKMQWKNLGFPQDTTAAKIDSTNFQVWLYENNSDVEVHWGNSYAPDLHTISGMNRVMGFLKNYNNPSAYMFDSIFYVSSATPATVDSTTFASFANNITSVGFDTTYPSSGVVFRFAKPSTGISGLALNDYIEVYPTLVTANTTVAISKLDGKTEIYLIDMSGKTVLSQPAILGENQLNMSNLPAGTYVLGIVGGGEKVYYKISKQ